MTQVGGWQVSVPEPRIVLLTEGARTSPEEVRAEFAAVSRERQRWQTWVLIADLTPAELPDTASRRTLTDEIAALPGLLEMCCVLGGNRLIQGAARFVFRARDIRFSFHPDLDAAVQRARSVLAATPE